MLDTQVICVSFELCFLRLSPIVNPCLSWSKAPIDTKNQLQILNHFQFLGKILANFQAQFGLDYELWFWFNFFLRIYCMYIAPRMAGILVKIFAWFLESRIFGTFLLYILKGNNLIHKVSHMYMFLIYGFNYEVYI